MLTLIFYIIRQFCVNSGFRNFVQVDLKYHDIFE